MKGRVAGRMCRNEIVVWVPSGLTATKSARKRKKLWGVGDLRLKYARIFLFQIGRFRLQLISRRKLSRIGGKRDT